MELVLDTYLDMLSALQYSRHFSLTLTLTVAIIASYYFVKWSNK